MRLPVCWSGPSPEECLRGPLLNSSQNIALHRRLTNGLALGLITMAMLIVTVPLFLILGTVISRGVSGLNWAFFTQIPKPIGEVGGGMVNAIAGSVMLLAVASLIGVPLGVGAGVYLAEYGRNKWGNIVRFTADVLNGVPSIVIGLTAYALVVVVQKHFSLLAGSVALSIMLAFARIAGETAPLMFTALGNQYWSKSLNQPTAALPLQIFAYAVMPYDEAHRQAWTGALVLIGLIMLTVIVFRFIASRGAVKGAS